MVSERSELRKDGSQGNLGSLQGGVKRDRRSSLKFRLVRFERNTILRQIRDIHNDTPVLH
jgi:hypothetical protein